MCIGMKRDSRREAGNMIRPSRVLVLSVAVGERLPNWTSREEDTGDEYGLFMLIERIFPSSDLSGRAMMESMENHDLPTLPATRFQLSKQSSD